MKHDLCPYICTFPDCPQPDTLYESRDQWIQHEQWSHMCFWRCPKDDIEFEDLPSYKIHVIAQHPVAAEKNPLLSEGVLATQRFLAKQPSRSCPFCDVDLDSVGEMYDHIGSHLETVALLAIPQLDDRELQPNSDAASLVAAGKDAGGSRKNDFDETLPVVFPENYDSDECSTAEQGLSSSDFEFHLARVPEQQQDERLSGHWQRAKFPCFMMDTHTRNQDFFGRGGVLQALDNVLLPSLYRQFDTKKSRHAALCGMGGIGKTSIAVEFAFSRRVHFDAVFWVNAATLPKLEHSFAEIAVKLGLVETWESSDHVILRELVKDWLENPQKPVIEDNHSMIHVEAHWLLIFDGADQPEILHDYWPLPNTGSILTTSRDPLSKSINSFTTAGIDLLSFEDEESAAFLQRLCPEDDGHVEIDAFNSLARMSGGIPLMICRMASFIRHHKLTFANYLSMCRADPGLLDGLFDDVGASVWTTAIEGTEPRPRALLEICAVLDARHIEERLFTSSIPNKDVLSGLLRSKSTYLSARAVLLQQSLVEYSSIRESLCIHRVIQNSVWSHVGAEHESAVLSAAIHLLYHTLQNLTHHNNLKIVRHAIRLGGLVGKTDRDLDRSVQIQLAEILVRAGW